MKKIQLSPKRLRVFLATVILILAVSTIFLAYEYESELNFISAFKSQYKNGIQETEIDGCVADARQNRDEPSTLYIMESMPNWTRLYQTYSLETYWPSPINSSTFIVYEIWNVPYLFSNITKEYSSMHMNLTPSGSALIEYNVECYANGTSIA